MQINLLNSYKKYIRICRLSLAVLVTVWCGGCAAQQERLTITMMTEQFTANENTDGGHWLKKIEQYTDSDLQVQMIPTLEYASQTERMIRNDSLPMVVTANETVLNKEVFYAYLKSGGFWQLDEYLDDYPELKSFIGKENWEDSRIQGRIYGIPRLRIRPRYAACYREDWAKSLGIDPPETLDEIYGMLKAFAFYDPDGNGINDTAGLADSWLKWGSREWNGIQTVTTALGGPKGWEYREKEETMVPDFASEEYLQTLTWFRRLYEEGILDHTFSFLTPIQRNEYFVQGRAGMIFCVIDDIPGLEDEMRQINPDAKLAILPLIREEGQEYRVSSTAGYNGLILFNRLGNGAIKSEEELRNILSFYNQMCGKEGQELLLFGSEGEYYTVEDNGEKRLIYEEGNNKSVLSAVAGSYIQLMPLPVYVRTAGDSPLQREVYNRIEEREDWLVKDDSYGLYSETYAALSDELNRIIQKASIRYIMGEITETDYWQEYQAWYDRGGRQVIEEYTKGYKAKQNQ